MPDSAATRQAMISVAEAQATIAKQVRPASIELRPLETARGEVLREEIRADRDLPPFDRVAMNGIAIAHSDYAAGVRRYRVAGIQAAGMPRGELRGEGECLEVMTGVILPKGCDCVVAVEQLVREGPYATIGAEAIVRPMQNVPGRVPTIRREACC